jgi:hypothetical protein
MYRSLSNRRQGPKPRLQRAGYRHAGTDDPKANGGSKPKAALLGKQKINQNSSGVSGWLGIIYAARLYEICTRMLYYLLANVLDYIPSL